MEKVIIDVPAYVRGLYARHLLFAHGYYNISIDEIKCGQATLSLQPDPGQHCDQQGRILGPVLEALADITLEVTGASVGAVVSLLNFSMNFISRDITDGRISATARIKHHGRTTMVAEVEVQAENGKLLATVLSTMYISSRFEEIPAKW